MVELKEAVGKRIQQTRERLDLTQEELGERAELTYGYVGQIERGIKAASLKTLKKIADVLGVSVAFLFQDDKDITKISDKDLAMREILSLLRNKPKESIKLIFHIAKTILKEIDKNK